MYCLPAIIYIGLSLIGLLYTTLSGLSSIGGLLFQLLFIWLFSWFLDYLCRNGYTIASWVLVLFPFIFMFALIFGVLMMTAAQSKDIKIVSNAPAPA